ncbi:MAG: XTP/dITP diphosphohydrolase [Verrucomicrobiota bacterium]|jgi:XTP/dITP diphosphohydrolase
MFRLLLATRNAHKTREFSEILGEDFAVRDLTSELEIPAVEETGSTFAENAILKAAATSKHFPDFVVGDDSGLEVDALEGAPGIYSARYAGEYASDQENIAKLLAELAKHSKQDSYSARFRCVLALARQGTILGTFEGIVEGAIVAPPRGDAGFGYDPVFQPLGLTQTFAELPPAQKNEISHRGKAIRALRIALLA